MIFKTIKNKTEQARFTSEVRARLKEGIDSAKTKGEDKSLSELYSALERMQASRADLLRSAAKRNLEGATQETISRYQAVGDVIDAKISQLESLITAYEAEMVLCHIEDDLNQASAAIFKALSKSSLAVPTVSSKSIKRLKKQRQTVDAGRLLSDELRADLLSSMNAQTTEKPVGSSRFRMDLDALTEANLLCDCNDLFD